MKFRKTTLVALVCILCLCAMNLATAATTDQRVFDRAGLFTDSEIKALEAEIIQFQKDTDMDFVVLTSKEAHSGSTSEQIADDFYDQYGFGLDDEHSGVLYYIDMYERYQHLSTTGQMIDYMTDERIESAINACTRSLSSGDYSAAATTMLSRVKSAIRSGVPERQYQYDIVTGQRLTPRHKALTMNEIMISAVISLVVGLLFVMVVKRRYQLKGSTYKYSYRLNSQVSLIDTDDTFLRSATTRRHKPSPSSGGGGGFGGGGGSGVHTGSSGTSHGGGGGHF